MGNSFHSVISKLQTETLVRTYGKIVFEDILLFRLFESCFAWLVVWFFVEYVCCFVCRIACLFFVLLVCRPAKRWDYLALTINIYGLW